MLCENIGKRISSLRKEKKISRDELAERANISKNYLGMIERGDRPQLSIKIIEDLAIALGVTLSDLLKSIEDANAPDMTNEEIANAAYKKEILNTCYPVEHSMYPISSLMKFLLYLPLVNPEDLIDALDRISGTFVDQESYVLQKINDCIERIPPSPALSFAQAEEKKISRELAIRRFGFEDLTAEDSSVLLYWNKDERTAYENKIANAKELLNILKQLENWQMKAK